MSRRNIPTTGLFAAFAAAVLLTLTACGSSGVGDILGSPRDSGSSYPSSVGGVRGTVERVDTRDRFLVVNADDTYRSNLRNGNEQITVYYDDSTRVQYEGRTFRPDDLERGDRVEIDVDQSGSRMIAQDIQVLYDATAGTSTGTYNDDYRSTSEVRGTVRYVDTRARTLEIEPRSSSFSTGSTGRSDVVIVRYDTSTTVEFEGRSYKPENLERGDEVEIEVRDLNGQLTAEQILVVGEGRSIGR
jgi:bifunctional DNA-binding transcriptional regulator/antitoxin component of YhaV-PrlF toxin-antitoxin module